jgi:hypothetical protein
MNIKKPRIALSMSKAEETMQNKKIDIMKVGMERMHNDLVIISKKLDKLQKCLCEMED